ncbi:T9SS type A sorting domain-containing protein [Reichenbachiella carrageenanivorans]|uniref:T9SS type A sorting domain-containing protein n=1 Tax=Reichenbachiella carrageenanivorans TaxID=2979869 RepID=A0ABY6D0L1_9BACT|nr:T9SS type A sorting domain-containing protein [Reichenbachiella carrageenanivorans]UXX79712.1 T9SS type A sorting domain-containing protein [Reichenbachiella carrageenanivorans]
MNPTIKNIVLLFACFLPFIVKGQPEDYYLAPAPTGDDSNDCLLSGDPCATLDHIMTLVADNDNIYVEGGVYMGSPTIDHTIKLIDISGKSTFGIVTLNANINFTIGLMEAEVVQVNPGGSIQDAVDLCPPSGAGYIEVRTGVYNESVTFNKDLSFTSISDPITITNIEMDNGATLTTDANMTISGNVTLTNGIINTQSTLYLGTGASDIVETNSNYVTGKVTMLTRPVGTGSIDFLGANVTNSSNIGDVTITRTTGSAAVVDGNPANSIAVVWDITSTGTPSATSLELHWVSPFDNGLTLNPMDIYRKTGSNWDANNDPADASGRTINFLNIDAFGSFTVSEDGSSLPVELLAFDATDYLNHVFLQWQTASEINHDYFEIQRSRDGENFEAIGRLSSHHNSYEIQTYDWKDYSPSPSSTSYYRLKMVDFDGSFEYSKTIAVTHNAGSSITLYPNPAKESISITADAEIERIEIFNTSGQQLRADLHDHTIDLSGIAPGIYALAIVSSGGVSVKKFIKE